MVLIEIWCIIFIHISKKRKQCVRLNSTTSNFKHILSGARQRSILGPIFYNLLFNDFFFHILIVPAHNFGHDSLSHSAATVEDLMEPLQSEWLLYSHGGMAY